MTTSRFDDITRDQLSRPDSRKWSLHAGTIGAWVAEMDFGTAPVVTEALHRAIDDGDLGYLAPATTRRMAEAASEWLRTDCGWAIAPENIHPVSDVMAALEVAVTKYSPAGSGVIIPTPAYMPFLSFIPTLGREVFEVPGIESDGRWTHDLDGIEAAFHAGARTLILCNPHNPTGTAISREELEAIAVIVDRHNGRVFADEIHSPLRYGSTPHVAYASISAVTARHTITATSASKAWNIPGLKAAQLITSNLADEELYQIFGFAVLHGASTPGVIAATAAYRNGREWLTEVTGYLDGNRRELGRLLAEHLPEVGYRIPEATYIAWLDCRRLGIEGSLADFFRTEAGVAVTDGAQCGKGYEGYVRLIFAMPRPILEQAVLQMRDAVLRHTAQRQNVHRTEARTGTP
ncbi:MULTISPECIES: MalY/PatB family protein [unclassified Cryobacterium]|uniref:MalY/PatB family protein n=1 Tax=unclassified Cryobacterium TaxID=2649013 RepID=UPI002AB3CB55|nr:MULTISPECIES: aminotransferase class I/II-fold pyridoxal phosphate-dependent enzyme [unclassified Cryobacterium]MDY7542692.1 aminotransferase class I/II-fold pyridoxal phosphate-dependent enzyme [Cryobacterium sp. 5B3]MEB0267609.1 aminotransferase class I/II-fold pyridoxal phosphate-dependent enzyme [Cryobacterium sp. 10I5]MEB0276553.1 aminotransferase class I/II-fold pyridoxal phosphate-dependent enzyme [Cryobacterium sp. 5B3]